MRIRQLEKSKSGCTEQDERSGKRDKPNAAFKSSSDDAADSPEHVVATHVIRLTSCGSPAATR